MLNEYPDRSGSPAPLIDGISAIADDFDYFILDVFGVIHNGVKLYDETLPAFEALKAAGKKICLLSNSPKRAHKAREDLARLGLEETMYDDIVTAGEAAHQALCLRSDDFHKFCGYNCWFVGTEMMEHIVDGLSLNSVENIEDADFILNSVPGTSDWNAEELKRNLEVAAKRDIPMVCANPDMVVNIGDNQYECAGTYARYYEERGGRVAYHGKPYAEVYDMVRARFGNPPKEKMVAIGDSLHTDVQGAQNFGIGCLFNLKGIHWEDVKMDHSPDEADLDKIRLVIDNQPFKPLAIISGLKW